MKRYLIFAAVGPFVGGLLLLLVTTYQSGYFAETSAAEIGKLLVIFAKTLQYSYLFGLVPALMMGAIDDILYHVRRIRPVLRVLIVGLAGFTAAVLYSARGPGSGLTPNFLYGLVGLVPATLSAWLSHKYADEQKPAKA
ncbi:DUF5413 family protein [Bradyrhizobium sp.]|uniref:DUF5413 family protein n=1 Tax=Bradyrhizobium sp. TaxID=376 RepID=UPI004037E048